MAYRNLTLLKVNLLVSICALVHGLDLALFSLVSTVRGFDLENEWYDAFILIARALTLSRDGCSAKWAQSLRELAMEDRRYCAISVLALAAG